MTLLPEVILTTVEIKIEDIQVGEPEVRLTDDQEKLRQLIRKNQHLLKGKDNALPPAARGAICDIASGRGEGTNPISQRVRPVASSFEKKWQI